MPSGNLASSRTGRTSHLALVLLAALFTSCGGEPEGAFSPLIEPGSTGKYSLMLEGVPDIRGASLAPGAAPAVARIEGARATRKGHFLATYSGEAVPAEIGQQMVDALKGAAFIETATGTGSGDEDSWSATIRYETAGAEGTVRLTLSRTETPGRLDVTFDVEEQRR